MTWNKFELYDDLYPWAIRSDDGQWIIAKDTYGNTVLFCNRSGTRKIATSEQSPAVDSLKLYAEGAS